MSCKQLWMKVGTSKKPKYLPTHMIRENLKQTVPGVETILSFHAITGCDTVSYFAGHSKKTSWKTFTEHQRLLRNLENGDLHDSTVRSVETFICGISSVTDAENCNKARATLFSRCRSSALPPTSDAARWHIGRAHFQAMVWKQARYTLHTTKLNGKLVAKLMSLVPVP